MMILLCIGSVNEMDPVCLGFYGVRCNYIRIIIHSDARIMIYHSEGLGPALGSAVDLLSRGAHKISLPFAIRYLRACSACNKYYGICIFMAYFLGYDIFIINWECVEQSQYL